MKSKLPLNRFSPLTLKNGVKISNRIVVPAMASETADSNGLVSSKTESHYLRLAQSGAGIIIVEYSYIHESGKSEPNQLGISQDNMIDGLSKISHIIKRCGALAGMQITHSGAKSSKDLTGGILMAPSNLSVPVKDKVLETPTSMNQDEVNLWIQSFVSAARRAVSAGFDFIELHAAHGYGINQWLSSITNARTDSYGGTLNQRLKILSEIISEIQKALPTIMISVRIPGKDFLENGLSLEDGIFIAKHLEDLGVNLINVSSGIGGWRRPKDRIGQGYLLEEAIQIQKFVNIPVIGVGGIESGDFIDEVISKNQVQLTAVGRAILKDPAKWHQTHLA